VDPMMYGEERPARAQVAAPGGVLDGRSWAPLAIVRDGLTWRSAIFLLIHMAFGIAYFVGLVVLIPLSFGLVPVFGVGILLMALTMIGWRGAAMLERNLMRAAFGIEVPSPYRKLPDGNVFRKWRAWTVDPATWKDLAYLLLAFPIATLEFAVSVAVWATAGSFLLLPLTQAIVGGTGMINFGGNLTYAIHNPVEALPFVPLGAGLMFVAIYVTRIMAVGHASFARLLLGPSENQLLRSRTAHLQASRARGVDAAESERRRIERDLHDGAQQQLLAVAMDIGRARAKLESDPEAARALIEQAHVGAREAITELRNLARGIYPAILTDRGLDPALSALAARAPVPVEVNVDLPTRPPAAVESIAYFIVAEALSNIAKYARATRAGIEVTRDGQWVIVEITDNGVGGANAQSGGGLAGLADRAATIDGILTVNSPLGGPTVIRADLPCAW
jgi:signal transduction histidine kinase